MRVPRSMFSHPPFQHPFHTVLTPHRDTQTQTGASPLQTWDALAVKNCFVTQKDISSLSESTKGDELSASVIDAV